MFKFNNCELWTYFTPCSSVSIVNSEHAIAGWEWILTKYNVSRLKKGIDLWIPEAAKKSQKLVAAYEYLVR